MFLLRKQVSRYVCKTDLDNIMLMLQRAHIFTCNAAMAKNAHNVTNKVNINSVTLS